MNPFLGSQATVLNRGGSSSASQSMEKRGDRQAVSWFCYTRVHL
ncbi:hypothetical protein [Laspinema palackyanum]